MSGGNWDYMYSTVSLVSVGSKIKFICDDGSAATNFPIRTCLGNDRFDPPFDLPGTGANYPAC